MINFAADMLRLPKIIHNTLSVRLSLIVVSFMAILLMASLVVMMVYARKALKEEALHKAAQTLEATLKHIDIILLNVEQTTGNFYFQLYPHLNDQKKMLTFCRQLVESNPYVEGCAIAFKPGYYQEGENFMAYYHRTPSPTPSQSDTTSAAKEKMGPSESFSNSPYTEQTWFTVTMRSGKPGWMKPITDESISVITFCLPILDKDNKPVATMGVDVSLGLLTRIVETTKFSKHSYCTLLDSDGSYIVHPDSNKLYHQNVFTQLDYGADASVEAAAKAMLSGETGYKPFLMNDSDYFVFYKPFKRTVIPGRTKEELGWSAGFIYPADDVFGDYNNLQYYVLAIAAVGLLLLFLLCRTIFHRQLLPLRMLIRSARSIASGHYDETIPDSRQHDEIGRLQDNFQQLQQSLATHIGELEQQTTMLKERGESLRIAYNHVQKADRMKTAFLHNMTNQMAEPSEAIDRDVDLLMGNVSHEEIARIADNMQKNGKIITELLNNLLNISDEEKRKEADHV